MVSRPELLRATGAAASFYWRQLHDRPDGWAARHLRERGVGDEVLAGATGWWLGYAPDKWTGLVDQLHREGFDDETLVAAGLAGPTRSGYLIDRFRDRIMFLAEDRDANPVGFVGRAWSGRPRYLNTPGTEIYSKAKAAVGVGAQRRRLSEFAMPVFVEGTMDALAISQLGTRWAGVSTCGAVITSDQALMVRKAARLDTVIVAFDGDTGGRNGAVRSLDVLSDVFGVVLAAELPDEHDPSSLFAADPDRLREALIKSRPLAQLAIDVELSRWDKVLDHISGQVNAVRAVAPLMARLPAGRVAAAVAGVSRKTGLEPQLVSREVLAAVGLRRKRRTTRRRTNRSDDPDLGADPPGFARTP
jgi:DNA primase